LNYFLLIDGNLFEERLRPALAASRRRRSFEPCRHLCRDLLDRVKQFHARYHVGEGESLVEQVAGGLAYDRDFWSALAGELLFYAADDIPEFSTCLDTLRCLVTPEQLLSIEQAHRGSRPLTFGAAVYRPDECGLNDREDVRRLAETLGSIDPLDWQPSSLARLPELAEEDREDELGFARDWFPSLVEMYRRAAGAGQVIVREML
jgi:hypothetical protein